MNYLGKFFFCFALFAWTFVSAAPSITPSVPKKVDGCYQIGTAAELYGFAAVVNGSSMLKMESDACGKLTDNIKVNTDVLKKDTLNGDGSNFVPWTPMENFAGKFDGQFHTISGLYFNDNEHDVALFGSVQGGKEGDSVVISNFGIEDTYFFGGMNTAGAIAFVDTSYLVMENVYNAGFNISYLSVKGLIATMERSHIRITNAFNSGPVDHNRDNCDIVNVGGNWAHYKSQYTFGIEGCNVYTGSLSSSVSRDEYLDGSVAALLHYSPSGKIWGQKVGEDSHPVFSGKIQNYAGSLKFYSLSFHNVADASDYVDGYVEGREMELPAPKQDGYVFMGWFDNSEFRGNPIKQIEKTMSGDKNLYAMWGKVPQLVDNCYEIGTAEELYGFSGMLRLASEEKNISFQYVDKYCAKLTKDIVIDNQDSNKDKIPWFPIVNFAGVFDGGGKTITGLYFFDRSINRAAFIESAYSYYKDSSYTEMANSVVKDLGLIDPVFVANSSVGSFVGLASGVDLINVYRNGGSVEGDNTAGGLIGHGFGNVEQSYNRGVVRGRYGVGGLVGSWKGTIANSFSVGFLSFGGLSCCDTERKGLFVGDANVDLSVINSFAAESPSSKSSRYGLVGSGTADFANAFILDSAGKKLQGLNAMPEDFMDGSVAKLLRNYKGGKYDGSVWGQRVGVDSLPLLSNELLIANGSKDIAPVTPSKRDGCFLIGSVEELYGFVYEVHARRIDSTMKVGTLCGKLTKDITLNKNLLDGDNKLVAGNYLPWFGIRGFDGILDGNGHSVVGLYMSGEEEYHSWTEEKFGFITSVRNESEKDTVKIENFGIEKSYFFSFHDISGLIVQVDTLSGPVLIKNSHVDFVTDGSYSSGLVRKMLGRSLVIEESYVEGTNSKFDGMVSKSVGEVVVRNSYCAVESSNDEFYPYFLVPSTDKTTIENSYVLSTVLTGGDEGTRIVNSFALKGDGFTRDGVGYVSMDMFKDGTVARLLHNYHADDLDGSVWGQVVGMDDYPVLSGELLNLGDLKFSKLTLVTYDKDSTKYMDEYAEGVPFDLPVPSREGYVFKGWYASADFSGEEVVRISKDKTGPQTFYSKWWHKPVLVNGCYEIGDVGELFLFADIVNNYGEPDFDNKACARITNNIVVNSHLLKNGVINKDLKDSLVSWPSLYKFGGSIYGGGHTISGLYGGNFISSVDDVSSLKPVIIDSLGIIDSYFGSFYEVGGFVGRMNHAFVVISNSYSEANVVGSENCGGLVGEVDRSHLYIVNSHNSGVVQCDYDGGGLVGLDGEYYGSISIANSYNDAPVSGYDALGGLVGQGSEYVYIVNSYNVGKITGRVCVGGLVGDLADETIVDNSYNMGEVSGDSLVGNLWGRMRKYVEISADNVFFADGIYKDTLGIATPMESFADRTLVGKLQSYRNESFDGSVWGQKTSDAYPKLFVSESADAVLKILEDKIPKSSSSSMVSPVSSESASSSSVSVPSSSEKVSSSSEPVSSSSKKSSSSSNKSSSSSKRSSSSTASSSSNGKTDLPLALADAHFAITVVNREVFVHGAEDCAYALFDVQGKVILRGSVRSKLERIVLPHAGSYLIRVGSSTRKIFVE